MFQHSYQSGGFLEVFHTKTDKEKDKVYEKLYKVTNAAGFKKVYDKVTKGYIYELDGIRSSLHFPSNEKQDLGLIQPFLVLQVYLPPGSPFSVEVTITDTLKNKRRLHFSTGIRQLEKNYFHAKIPLDVVKRGVWMNLSFDLLSFFELFKGQTFRSIDSFIVGAVCKIRRIFTMKGPIADFSGEDDLINPQSETKMIPKTQNFPPGVTYANQLINLDLIKSYFISAGGLQPEESIAEESSTTQQGTKPKTAAPSTKQPLGTVNTKKDALQSIKSPLQQVKIKAPVMPQKGVRPQENTERIETVSVARGKENIRENTAPILGQRRKIENVPQKKDFTVASNKPSSINNEDFDDEKIWKNVPKPYKKPVEQKPKFTEIPSQQGQPDSFSQEDDYEEQKQDPKHDFKSSFGISSRAATAKTASSKNPWATFSSTSIEQNLKKIDPQENTASSSTMDTRKNLENTDPSAALEDTKASEVYDKQATLDEDAEFSSIWKKIVDQDQGISAKNANVKSPGNWENAFEAKDLRKFSPLQDKEEADEAVRSTEEDREREEREKERFGTMNWEFMKRSSTEEEDEIESVEEDLAFEVEEKIAMRDDREEFGNQWKRQEIKANEEKEKAEGSGVKEKKCVWESNQRRSISEFEIKWKDQEHEHEHEQQKERNSLVVQEDGSGEEEKLEDSLEAMVDAYVKKRNDDEKIVGKAKKNTKRTLSLIDDQVQDMMLKTRPYSPPFGQTLSDENKEEGKWCLDGVKTMKSSEGEDSDKAENKEEVEVVYDPVWKCYYDPKTNSYFELK